jgi:hypothetical protein
MQDAEGELLRMGILGSSPVMTPAKPAPYGELYRTVVHAKSRDHSFKFMMAPAAEVGVTSTISPTCVPVNDRLKNRNVAKT